MKSVFKIAWRSLWRNKRRTLITASSVFFGVFFSIYMTSLMKGSMNGVVHNMVKLYSGYIQIVSDDYFEEKIIDNAFEVPQEVFEKLDEIPTITTYTKRIQSFTLLAGDENSYGAAISGINAEDEEKISELNKYLVEGIIPTETQPGIIIGVGLAERLKVKLNDSLALIGIGYRGLNVAELMIVRGIFEYPIDEANSGLAYLDLKSCQNYLDLGEKITSTVIMVKDQSRVDETIEQIESFLPEGLSAKAWYEIVPDVVQLVEGKEGSSSIMKGLLFLIIGFGIFGTIVMLMAERARELAVMVALGTQKKLLSASLMLETFFIGFLGIVMGLVVMIPTVLYFFNNPIQVGGKMAETYQEMGFEPILYFALEPSIFIKPAIAVFVITLFVGLYQLYAIKKLKPIVRQ